MAFLDLLLGPLVLGVSLNLMLYGLMVMQTYMYFLEWKRDIPWIRYLVAFLFAADTLNSAFDLAFLYDYLVNKFGNMYEVTRTTWLFNTDPVMTAIIAGTVQFFFAWRVMKLTGQRWIAAFILLFAFCQLLGGIGTTIGCTIIRPFFELRKIRVVVIIWLGFSALNDVLITASLVWYLRSNKTGFAVTDGIITKLIRSTVQTGAVTSFCAVVDLVLFLTMDNSLHLIFNLPLCKLYTNSLLSVLNARSRLEASRKAELNSENGAAQRVQRSQWRHGSMNEHVKSKTGPLGGISVTTRTDIHTDNFAIELGGAAPVRQPHPLDKPGQDYDGMASIYPVDQYKNDDNSSWGSRV